MHKWLAERASTVHDDYWKNVGSERARCAAPRRGAIVKLQRNVGGKNLRRFPFSVIRLVILHVGTATEPSIISAADGGGGCASSSE